MTNPVTGFRPTATPRRTPAPGPQPPIVSAPPARPAGHGPASGSAVAPVKTLPGALDRTPVLNSNHPEILHGPGIAVSTLPGPGEAHLDYAFRGTFEVFTHHQNRSGRVLFQAVTLHNPSDRPVAVAVGPSAAAVTADAPYRDHGPRPVDDRGNQQASGPGDMAAGRFLRGARAIAAPSIVLAPGETRVVHALRLPVGNEGTGHFRFTADGPVHGAVVIEDAPPTHASVTARLAAGHLVARNPEDRLPTPPGAPGQLIFGRVAGVQEGAAWRARVTNDAAGQTFQVTDRPSEQGFLIVGKRTNTLGTGQDHAAALLRRYPDSAYAAHGNYGVTYEVSVPLRNTAGTTREVSLYLDSPGKELPLSRVFRGAIALDITGPDGQTRTEVVHVSQKAGELGGAPLVRVKLAPGETSTVRARLVYPANSTPPHVLRVATGPAAVTPNRPVVAHLDRLVVAPLDRLVVAPLERLANVVRAWFQR